MISLDALRKVNLVSSSDYSYDEETSKLFGGIWFSVSEHPCQGNPTKAPEEGALLYNINSYVSLSSEKGYTKFEKEINSKKELSFLRKSLKKKKSILSYYEYLSKYKSQITNHLFLNFIVYSIYFMEK